MTKNLDEQMQFDFGDKPKKSRIKTYVITSLLTLGILGATGSYYIPKKLDELDQKMKAAQMLGKILSPEYWLSPPEDYK